MPPLVEICSGCRPGAHRLQNRALAPTDDTEASLCSKLKRHSLFLVIKTRIPICYAAGSFAGQGLTSNCGTRRRAGRTSNDGEADDWQCKEANPHEWTAFPADIVSFAILSLTGFDYGQILPQGEHYSKSNRHGANTKSQLQQCPRISQPRPRPRFFQA